VALAGRVPHTIGDAGWRRTALPAFSRETIIVMPIFRRAWFVALLLPFAWGPVSGNEADAAGRRPFVDEDGPAVADGPAVQAPAAGVDGPAAPPATEPAGQQDLNDAIDAKLEVNDLDDFARVLELCRKAIDKGLDEDSRKFAEDLYTGTLIDRSGMLVEAIFDSPQVNPQWRQIRAFAMRDLDEVVRRDPTLGGVHLMIARLQSLPEGDRDRAAKSAAKALSLLGDDKLKRAEATVVLAELEPDPGERKALYDAAVELAPRDADVRRARGMFHLVEDDFEAARDDLVVAAEEQPRDSRVHEALGLACMMGDRMVEARAAFSRAIELEPDAVGPLLQRARTWALESEHAKALADIDRALDIEDGNAGALLLRARINQQAGDTDAALVDIEGVLANQPDLAAGLELRGLIAAEKQDYAAAIRDFRRLASKNADDPAILGQLGMLYLASKQPHEAIKRFTRALELDAQNFPCLRGRSDAEISIGDHAMARDDLEKAHALEPEDSGVLNNLAWLLATSPDEAIRNGQRAVELAKQACELTDWKEPHIISTLAAAHAEAGDFEAARTYSRQAVEQGGGNDEIKSQLEAELASYKENKPWRERQTVDDASGEGTGGVEPRRIEPPPAEAAQIEPELKKSQPAGQPQPRRPFQDD
jgi:tetratricopeptide (TPR) repeat protein